MSGIENKVWQSLRMLMHYVEAEEFKGYDPYDALNSDIVSAISKNSKYLRIVITQAMRRMPINIRPLVGIRKGLNPKGLGLFLKGYVKLLAITADEAYRERIAYLARLLEGMRSKGYIGSCWGYNFPWQNRYQLLPSFTPTIVNTSFISHGFLDCYELLKENRYLELAKSACTFILNDLRITYENEEELCLSYTPRDNSRVYNANLLGASLLARVYSYTNDENLLAHARRMVKYVIKAQNGDGSWYYGANKTQNWIDIHHSGFVLESLYDYMRATGDMTYLPNLEKGLSYFTGAFFLDGGRPKLWHSRKYPADIHSVQAIITLTRLHAKENEKLLEKLVSWIIDNLQDASGYFYYQKLRHFTNKISYMRWSQAWAFHALTTYYLYLTNKVSK